MHVFLMPVDSGHDSRPRMSTPPLCTGVCVCVCGIYHLQHQSINQSVNTKITHNLYSTCNHSYMRMVLQIAKEYINYCPV